MALPVVVSRNQIQVLDVNVQNEGNPNTIGTTPFVLYTCPSNKVALVKSIKVRFTGFGAGTTGNVRAKGNILRTTTSTETVMIESAGNGIRLVATETVDLNGDSGSNNESAFFDVTIQELSA